MGARGRTKTPTAILKLRGSYYADRNPNEPVPIPGRPEKPDWVKGDWQDLEWDRLCTITDQMNVLSQADGNVLGRYVENLAMWKDTLDFIRQHGTTYPLKDARGRVCGFAKWPQVSTLFELEKILIKIEQHFGLTPSARSRIAVNPPKEEESEPDEEGVVIDKAKFIDVG